MQVFFAEYRLFSWALLQKRRMFLGSLWIVAIPYASICMYVLLTCETCQICKWVMEPIFQESCHRYEWMRHATHVDALLDAPKGQWGIFCRTSSLLQGSFAKETYEWMRHATHVKTARQTTYSYVHYICPIGCAVCKVETLCVLYAYSMRMSCHASEWVMAHICRNRATDVNGWDMSHTWMPYWMRQKANRAFSTQHRLFYRALLQKRRMFLGSLRITRECPIGCANRRIWHCKIYVSSAEYRLFYRALLQKRRMFYFPLGDWRFQ